MLGSFPSYLLADLSLKEVIFQHAANLSIWRHAGTCARRVQDHLVISLSVSTTLKVEVALITFQQYLENPTNNKNASFVSATLA